MAIGFGASMAVAQPDVDAAEEGADIPVATAVVGTSTLVGEAKAGESTFEGGVLRVRDNVLVTVEDSSDPRVKGRATITVNYDAYPDELGMVGASQVRYGQMRLQNDEGAWSGHFTGSLANGGFAQTYWLEGEDAYEGLSYVVTAGGNGPVWRSQGLIFPGGLPPMGKGLTLPIEGPQRQSPTASLPGS
jgi:hypothetical protein